MRALVLAFLCLLAGDLRGGCLSFLDPPLGSDCSKSTGELSWLNSNRLLERVSVPQLPYDPQIQDPALRQGLAVKGELQFELHVPGPHLVEVFLAAEDDPTRSFLLEAGGKPVDTRYRATDGPVRLRPRVGLRSICLLGMVDGAFTVRSDSPRYIISAIRWTARREFEERLAPAWLERARRLVADPFLDDLRAMRRDSLEQLYDRLALSGVPEVRREAVIGQARAAYWLAAEDQEPRDIARTAALLLQALKLAPEDKVVREMVSSSCAGRNVSSGRMPQGGFCAQAVPVYWTVILPPDPAGAPAWAVTQRRLAARMDAITEWWVDRRQRSDGEIGGGWRWDAEILRQWGPQALGFGDTEAATGLKKIADGLWTSGLVVDGYSKEISDVEQGSGPSTDTQPLLAALGPDQLGVLERLRQTAGCAKNWIAQQPDGLWRFRSSWFNCGEADPSPSRALDVALNVRAVGPALWYGYLSRDRASTELVANWAHSWVAAMRSTDHGKPAGIFPPAVKSADGSYLIGSTKWDKPNAEWDYYQWSGRAQEGLTSLLLALHDLTGDAQWLEAAGQTFQILSHCQDAPGLCEEIVKAPQAYYEWRRRTGDARYDALFPYKAGAEPAAALSQMTALAKESEAALARDFEMYTSEAIYTDRVFYPLSPEYSQYLFGGDAPRGERYPSFAVTWPASDAQFARAVLESTSKSLTLRLYNFDNKPAKAQVRLWRLEPGKYSWESADMAGASIGKGEFSLTRRTQTVTLPLPPASEIAVSIRQIEP